MIGVFFGAGVGCDHILRYIIKFGDREITIALTFFRH
jgi:hypothetical protein